MFTISRNDSTYGSVRDAASSSRVSSAMSRKYRLLVSGGCCPAGSPVGLPLPREPPEAGPFFGLGVHMLDTPAARQVRCRTLGLTRTEGRARRHRDPTPPERDHAV